MSSVFLSRVGYGTLVEDRGGSEGGEKGIFEPRGG